MALKNWCYFIAAGCAVGGAAPAFAQKAPAKPATPAAAPAAAEPAWTVICPQAPAPAAGATAPATPVAAPACGLVQNLVAGEKKQRLLTVIIKRTAPTGNNMTLALPHGLLFAPGVGLQVDEAAERSIAVQTSDENGAYAGTAIDADFLKSLQGGKTLKISFTGGTGQRIIIPVTLKDFAPGMAALGKTPLAPAPTPAAAPKAN